MRPSYSHPCLRRAMCRNLAAAAPAPAPTEGLPGCPATVLFNTRVSGGELPGFEFMEAADAAACCEECGNAQGCTAW